MRKSVAVVVSTNSEPECVVQSNADSLLKQTVKADVYLVGKAEVVPEGVQYIQIDKIKGAAQREAMVLLSDEYDILVFLDGDYKYPTDAVERLILPLKYKDIAYSSISQVFLPMAWATRSEIIHNIVDNYPDVDHPSKVRHLLRQFGMPASIPFKATLLRGGRSPAWKKYEKSLVGGG